MIYLTNTHALKQPVYRLGIAFIRLSVLLLFSTAAWSTSIQQLDFGDLVERAELVFEGRVIGANSRWNATRTEIVTEIQFDVVDVIKGRFAQTTLTLEFLGGKVGEQSMLVQSMVYPKLGEQGVYFVESIMAKQVNPLLGWSQGHFLVVGDGVQTNTGQAVIDVDAQSKAKVGQLSTGTVDGISVRKKSLDSETSQVQTTVSLDAFKSTIKQIGSTAADK